EEKYLIPLMNWIMQEHPYWNKTNGRDHIMVHPMDRGSLYYPKSQNLMLNASFLTIVGDKRISGFMEHRYRRMRDIVIPSATRILKVAKINPRDYVDDDGNKNNRDIFATFRDEAHLIDEILLSITENEYQRKRHRVWEIGSQIDKNPWHYIARDLCRMLDQIEPIKLDL
ncbi:8541_t:CDS:2, partial [Racocetra fulgida]